MENKIKKWIDSVEAEGCKVHSFSVLNEIRKKNGKLLFALVDAKVTSPEEISLPHIVFIRGHACVIVPLIENTSTGVKKFLMVRQRRIGSGQMSLEFPAGMLDEDSDDPEGVAVRELQEETGLQISSSSLFPLHKQMLFSSVGGSDEGIYYYGCIVRVDDSTFRSFQNRMAGISEENECITVELISRNEAEAQTTTMQVPLGFYLFDKYYTQILRNQTDDNSF